MGSIYQNLRIEQVTNDHFRAVADLDREHIILAAHFPGHPILPGVVILTLFRQLASQALNKKLRLKHAGNVKFVKPLIPGDVVEITSEFILSGSENNYMLEGKVFYGNDLIAKTEGLIYVEDEL